MKKRGIMSIYHGQPITKDNKLCIHIIQRQSLQEYLYNGESVDIRILIIHDVGAQST